MVRGLGHQRAALLGAGFVVVVALLAVVVYLVSGRDEGTSMPSVAGGEATGAGDPCELAPGATAPAAAATGQGSKLVPRLALRRVDVEADGGARVVTMQLTATPALPDNAALSVAPTDLVADGGKEIAASKLNGSAAVSGGANEAVVVTMTVDPTGATGGAYVGEVLVTSPAISGTSPPQRLCVVVAPTGDDGEQAVLAFLVLLAAALLGGAVHWLAATGVELARLDRLIRRIGRVGAGVRLPAAMVDALADGRAAVADGDLAEAKTALAGIDDTTIARLLEPARRLAHVDDRVAQQRALLDAAGGPAALRAAGLALANAEAAAAQGLRDGLWPPPTVPAGDGLETRIDGLVEVADTAFDALGAPAADAAKRFQAAREQVVAGAFAAAVDALLGTTRTVEERLATPAATEAVAVEAAAAPGGRGFSAWGVRHARLLVGIALAVVVALTGWATIYSTADDFGGLADWVQLVAWGFGVQIAGVTLADAAGKLGPPRS